MRATVQPGIALGALNDALKPDGLFFPVDPSTWARCTIGGMTANNSCGSKSIRYGLMADNVLAIDAILPDGARFAFGELPDNLGEGVPGIGGGAGAAACARWARRRRTRSRRVSRRSCGASAATTWRR